MNLATKPSVIAFVASLLLLAGIAEAIERPGEDSATVAINDVPGAASEQPSVGPTGGDPSVAPSADDGPASEEPSDDVTEATEGASPVQPSEPTSPSTNGAPPADPSEPTAPAPSPTASAQPTPAPTTTAQYPEANLYDDAAKTVGITDDTISMCGHAALSLAAAFDTSPDDLNVYWDVVADDGGIHGRNVEMEWKDDAYNGNQAVTAAENCKAENPFMILGGIGFDQIPQVRAWAEANQMLYLHHIAVEPANDPTYSFSMNTTVQAVGEQFGRYIARQHADNKVGIIWRDSENWRPGRDAGRTVLDNEGVDVVADHGVIANQGVYAQELRDFQVKGADVVWLWENALNAAQIINQANDQGYHPTWVVFPFQTTLDILTNEDGVHLEGVASWPSYVEGGYGDAFPEWGFDAEIARFEAAYAKYRPGTTTNDLLWQVWVGNKVMHQMFLDCGADCNRNRIAGMMLGGYQQQVDPACGLNFAHPRSFGGHIGGFSYFSQETFETGNGLGFRTTAYCVEDLG